MLNKVWVPDLKGCVEIAGPDSDAIVLVDPYGEMKAEDRRIVAAHIASLHNASLIPSTDDQLDRRRALLILSEMGWHFSGADILASQHPRAAVFVAIARAIREADKAAGYVTTSRQTLVDAARYGWLRSRDPDTIHHGGVFAGVTPENLIVNEDDLDRYVDSAMAAAHARPAEG